MADVVVGRKTDIGTAGPSNRANLIDTTCSTWRANDITRHDDAATNGAAVNGEASNLRNPARCINGCTVDRDVVSSHHVASHMIDTNGRLGIALHDHITVGRSYIDRCIDSSIGIAGTVNGDVVADKNSSIEGHAN